MYSINIYKCCIQYLYDAKLFYDYTYRFGNDKL